MVSEPFVIGRRFARAGVGRVTMHREAFGSAERAAEALHSLKEEGVREVGIALKLDTPLSALNGCVEACDYVHLMSVADIGSQGEPFDDRVLSRVEELHAQYPSLMVAVDGGISESTVEDLVRAGANRLIVGHALVESPTPAKTYARMLERALRGCLPSKTTTESVGA